MPVYIAPVSSVNNQSQISKNRISGGSPFKVASNYIPPVVSPSGSNGISKNLGNEKAANNNQLLAPSPTEVSQNFAPYVAQVIGQDNEPKLGSYQTLLEFSKVKYKPSDAAVPNAELTGSPEFTTGYVSDVLDLMFPIQSVQDSEAQPYVLDSTQQPFPFTNPEGSTQLPLNFSGVTYDSFLTSSIANQTYTQVERSDTAPVTQGKIASLI